MPPPREANNVLEAPGDYDVTPTVHSDTYPAIDPTKLDLTGKAVFITGGSRGIGRSIVLSYAKAGASFIAAGARSGTAELATAVFEAAKSSNRPTPKYLPLTMDMSNRESVEEAAAKVEREFGRCDILVNNAGIFGGFQLIQEYDPDTWTDIFEVNVRGPFLLTRALIPLMLRTGNTEDGGGDGAYIVNVSSAGALLTSKTISAYQISKTASTRLAEFINEEYSEKGILSFSVHPGNVVTDMATTFGVDKAPEFAHIFVDKPELCGDTLAFLTSEKRPWVGGRFINVTWDMPELLAKSDMIVKENQLKITIKY